MKYENISQKHDFHKAYNHGNWKTKNKESQTAFLLNNSSTAMHFKETTNSIETSQNRSE